MNGSVALIFLRKWGSYKCLVWSLLIEGLRWEYKRCIIQMFRRVRTIAAEWCCDLSSPLIPASALSVRLAGSSSVSWFPTSNWNTSHQTTQTRSIKRLPTKICTETPPAGVECHVGDNHIDRSGQSMVRASPAWPADGRLTGDFQRLMYPKPLL